LFFSQRLNHFALRIIRLAHHVKLDFKFFDPDEHEVVNLQFSIIQLGRVYVVRHAEPRKKAT
jgi:hypothetical protein